MAACDFVKSRSFPPFPVGRVSQKYLTRCFLEAFLTHPKKEQIESESIGDIQNGRPTNKGWVCNSNIRLRFNSRATPWAHTQDKQQIGTLPVKRLICLPESHPPRVIVDNHNDTTSNIISLSHRNRIVIHFILIHRIMDPPLSQPYWGSTGAVNKSTTINTMIGLAQDINTLLLAQLQISTKAKNRMKSSSKG